MDATGQWEVEVPTPLGRLRFDVRIGADGDVSANYRGRPIPVPVMRSMPKDEGLRVTWTQHLSVPIRIEVRVDALIVGYRLTGTADAGPLLPRTRMEG